MGQGNIKQGGNFLSDNLKKHVQANERQPTYCLPGKLHVHAPENSREINNYTVPLLVKIPSLVEIDQF